MRAARDEQSQLAASRQQAIEGLQEALQETQARLEAEISALRAARDEQSQLAASRQQAIEGLQETLQETQARLEADKTRLASKLTAALERIQSQEETLAEVSQRQQFMNDELIRAEAQIDLIKDMLLSEREL